MTAIVMVTALATTQVRARYAAYTAMEPVATWRTVCNQSRSKSLLGTFRHNRKEGDQEEGGSRVAANTYGRCRLGQDKSALSARVFRPRSNIYRASRETIKPGAYSCIPRN
jgi:hypothetical protein